MSQSLIARATIRAGAEALADPAPALLAAAERLAASVRAGGHGRRRAGPGPDFWQYRAAEAGDAARSIDWRRSARADQDYVRDREWVQVQTVQVWADGGLSMRYHSAPRLPEKAHRAAVLALALAILLEQGGERVGTLDPDLPPRVGRAQVERLAGAFARPAPPDAEFGVPRSGTLVPGGWAVLLSDFLGPLDPLAALIEEAAGKRMSGVLMQVLDPAEETFPFTGRTLFRSIGGGLSHEASEPASLGPRYRERLAERRDRLQALARAAGWMVLTHRTDAAPAPALWALGGVVGRRAHHWGGGA